MTHRAPDEILIAYAAGTLAPGPALVVAAHLSLCLESAERVRVFETLGGGALESVKEVALLPDALERALASVDARPAADIATKGKWQADLPHDMHMPRPLEHYDIGKWKFLAPGVRWSSIGMVGPVRNRPMLIRAMPGMVLPEHTHAGTEYTLVLKGSLHDAAGEYHVGDLIVADASLAHEPAAGSGEECICLAVVDGRLRMKSLVGRLVQPLLGF